jgi:hypothetical protein
LQDILNVYTSLSKEPFFVFKLADGSFPFGGPDRGSAPAASAGAGSADSSPREGPKFSSEALEQAKELARHLRLSAALLQAMEEATALNAALAAYKAAAAAYDPKTATGHRPRLIDFLEANPISRARLDAAFAALKTLGADSRSDWCLRNPCEEKFLAYLDGLTGEPLDLGFGLPASDVRIHNYCAACAMVGRPLPAEALPTPRSAGVLGGIASMFARTPVLHKFYPGSACGAFFTSVGLAGAAELAHRLSPGAKQYLWQECMEGAAENGQQELLVWLYSESPERLVSPGSFIRQLEAALKNKHNAVVDRLWNQVYLSGKAGPQTFWTDDKYYDAAVKLTTAAVSGDNMPMLRALRAAGCPWDRFKAFSTAIEKGDHNDISRLQALKVAGCPVNQADGECALRAGDRGAFEWLVQEFMFPLGLNDFVGAAVQGFKQDTTILDRLVQWCSLERLEVNSAAYAAAFAGSLPALQWAAALPDFPDWVMGRTSGPFEPQRLSGSINAAIRVAIGKGHLDCVRFLFDAIAGAGAPLRTSWDDFVYQVDVTELPSEEVIDLLTTRGFTDLSFFLPIALEKKDLRTLRLLTAKTGPLPEDYAMRSALRALFEGQGDQALPILQILVDDFGLRLATYDCNFCGAAASSARTSARSMDFLKAQGCRWDKDALARAKDINNLPLVRWMKTEGPKWV